MSEKIVIALGGNALGNTPDEQIKAVEKTAVSIVDLIETGSEVLICHGNGPQVGMIRKASELANRVDEKLPVFPLPVCGAMSEGYIGFHLQAAIKNELNKRNLNKPVVSLVTQVRVDENDPSFKNPTKPIGSFMTFEEGLKAEAEGKTIKEDAGRGYRQVVASPEPVEIIEKDSIIELVDKGFVVIAGGGGGIPVIQTEKGLVGVDAVIDKDFTSVKLAETIDANKVIILTAVDKVAIAFGKENEKWLDEMSVEEAEKYIDDGEFAPGSMLPKVKAAVKFASSKENRQAMITSLEKAKEALSGKTGTIVR